MKIHELENSNFYYDVGDQLKSFIYKHSEEFFNEGDAGRDAIHSIEELEVRRSFMYDKYMEAIGGLPENRNTMAARVTGTNDVDGYRVEKILIEARPKSFITANLYIPEPLDAPCGAVLFICGHTEHAKAHNSYQTICQLFVRTGLVVLAFDPIGQGERFSYFEETVGTHTVNWGTEEHSYAGVQCWLLGDSIARYFIHDCIRCIDYLCSRPEVDPCRIGITGGSGGGLQTCLMMMCEPRVAAAAPSTWLTNRRTYMHSGGPQDAEQIMPGMTALGFDHEDILMAMAPRPVLVLAAKYDFFTIEGTRRSVERTRRFWDMYGKGECICLFEDDSTHAYTMAMAKKAALFFSKHLLGKNVSCEYLDALSSKINPSAYTLLKCTQSGQVKGELEGARFVYDENADRADKMEKLRMNYGNGHQDLAVSWLKDRIFTYRRPCEMNPRFYSVENIEGFTVEKCFWWAQEGLINHAYLFRDCRLHGEVLPVTIAVWDGGTTEVQRHVKWLRKVCSSGRAVLVLDVSGSGALSPRSTSTGYHPMEIHGIIYKLATDLICMGDSLPAMRTYDILRTLELIGLWKGLKTNDIRMYGHGHFGLYVQFAAILDSRIADVETDDVVDSFTDIAKARYYDSYDVMSIILPGILGHFDLPDLYKMHNFRKGE